MSNKNIFPYQFKITTHGKIADPVIYLDVKISSGLRKIAFLVDSGSDSVVLPLSPYHFWFNFKPDPKTAITLGGIEGKGVTAYPAKITIIIGKEKLEVSCYFVKSNTMPLLGRIGIWNKFNLMFDNQNMQVVLERIKK